MVIEGLASLMLLALVVVIAIRRVVMRRHRSRIGPAAAGTVYDWLNKDRREAVEIVVEERAEARDPEDAEGNLPEIEKTADPKPKPKP